MPKESHQYRVYPLRRKRRRAFSHAKGHKGAECHPARDCSKHLAPLCSNSAMFAGYSGERLSSRFIMFHSALLANFLRILLARALVVHHEEHIASQQPYVDVRHPAEKSHHIPVEEITVTRRYQPVQCSGYCLLYPAETSNVTANCNYWRPYHEA